MYIKTLTDSLINKNHNRLGTWENHSVKNSNAWDFFSFLQLFKCTLFNIFKQAVKPGVSKDML